MSNGNGRKRWRLHTTRGRASCWRSGARQMQEFLGATDVGLARKACEKVVSQIRFWVGCDSWELGWWRVKRIFGRRDGSRATTVGVGFEWRIEKWKRAVCPTFRHVPVVCYDLVHLTCQGLRTSRGSFLSPATLNSPVTRVAFPRPDASA